MSGDDEHGAPADRGTSQEFLEQLAETRLADGRSVSSRELASILYDDLHGLAKQLFRGERGITFQPTMLVHEAWLRLADQKVDGWENRAQFMAVAALAMRRVLANAARDRARLKRGGDRERITLTGADPLVGDDEAAHGIDLVDLDAALNDLGRVSERYVRIVELRYFAGLSAAETGKVLGVGKSIVDREWAKARAHLAVRLEDAAGEGRDSP